MGFSIARTQICPPSSQKSFMKPWQKSFVLVCTSYILTCTLCMIVQRSTGVFQKRGVVRVVRF